jgi:molecular chaperone GrpE
MNEEKKDNVDVKNRQLFRVSQKVLFYNNQTQDFLILKAAKTKTGRPAHKEWMKKYGPWDLPGGHVDEGEENFEDALAREISEEVGVVLNDMGKLCRLELMINERTEHKGLNIIYLANYNGKIKLSEEHVEYLWASADEILEMKDVKPWIKDTIVKAEEQLESQESVERLHRCLADFDNYKKRQAQQQKEFTKYAAEGVINDMLPVLDNFHAATDHVPESEVDNPWVTGIMFIQQQMDKVFEEHNVTKIEVKVGDEFDPNTMEAIKNDNEELTEDARVEKIAQPGYRIGDKILRPVRVTLK